MKRTISLLYLLGVILCGAASASLPTGWTAQNFEAVGYTALDGRPAFKMAIKEKQGRWYLCAAHIFHSGLTVLDVTDPRNPRLLRFLPEAANTFTLQVDLAHNLMITSLEKHFLDPKAQGKPFDEGVVIWNIEELPEGKLVLQAEDVLVDRRGYAYVSHKNQGIWIVKYTGKRP